MSDALRILSSAYRSALGRLGLLGSRRRLQDRVGAGGLGGRLFRKYALLLVGLVSLVLLVNSGLHFWFSYSENKAVAFRIQQEEARAAARRIELFIEEIERQLGWTTAPQWAAGTVEQRRFDYVRLLRQVPAITELIQLDDRGKEQLKVSRVGMDVVASGTDYSDQSAFRGARQHRVWFSPVYFRKESEPYMTLAVAQAGRDPGVTLAEVNLKLIWDVIDKMKIGKGGYAFVVDREGRLIAHPDISLVLRSTDLSRLPQVAAALAQEAGAAAESAPAIVAEGIDHERVVTAHAEIPPLGWIVFVELPLREALLTLYHSALRNAALLAVAIGLATLAALFFARRMAGPIRELQASAARIGAGELDRRIELHTGDELEDLAGEFNRMAGDLQKSYAELENKVEERTAELKEALDQQTATAEVLGVINSSPGDLAPVFDAMLEKATKLCEAAHGQLATFEGERYQTVAARGEPAFINFVLNRGPVLPGPGTIIARIYDGETTVHIDDIAADEAYRPSELVRKANELGGCRTMLGIALRKDERALGSIIVYRREVRPFTAKQIALLQNFAAQAVIAMENARLLTETREALEQQTATAEVLQVINSSPGDLAPVFDAMLDRALQLCSADYGVLWIRDGDVIRAGAIRGATEEFAEFLLQERVPFDADMLVARAVRERSVIHLRDAKDSEPYRRGVPLAVFSADRAGIRTILMVPLSKEDEGLGLLTIYRREVRLFSEKEIALVQNFAAQAVIAMENARLITETREALEQQTATAEVLGVINSSPGDLAPVFDAMLEKAMRLCEAAFGQLGTYDGERFRTAATRGVPAAYVEYRKSNPPNYGPGTTPFRILAGERVIRTDDFKAEPAYQSGEPNRRAIVDLGGARSNLAVALRKDNAVLGFIEFYRQEVRPFSDKQAALLENFAAQAVIAMENARLITETREALDQQTATAEVLQVINSSPGDLAPVFEAILDKAHGLCGIALGELELNEDGKFRAVAMRGVSGPFAELLRQPFAPPPGSPPARLLGGEPIVQLNDLFELARQRPDDARAQAGAQYGLRTVLFVPLRKDDALLGYITAYRWEVRPFTEKEIALLQNFAAQAVIAMENTRLITETREALEQQTATAEVLQVINSSPGDLAPVFDSMLEKATRLCEAALGQLWTYDGTWFEMVASRGVPLDFADFLQGRHRPGPGTAHSRVVAGEDLVHISDIADEELYRSGDPHRKRTVELGGARSMLAVSLRQDEKLLGILIIYRQEVRPFSDKEIALVQNFAAQAVIAMENVRLITELRQRTHDLQESLEYQTATSDVLKVISQSVFDLDSVLQTVVTTAVRLCRADSATIYRNVDGEYRWAAGHMLLPDYEQIERNVRIRPGTGTLVGRAASEKRTVQILDAWTDPLYEVKDDARVGGVHTMIGVPLLREGAPIGVIGLARRRVEAFSEREIQLVTTFADQAVIAIENARLITELRQRTQDLQESLEYQTATSDVLKVISQSGANLDSVLDTVVETAARICDGVSAIVFRLRGDRLYLASSYGVASEYRDFLLAHPHAINRGTLVGRTASERRVVHILDVLADPEYTFSESQQRGDLRTMLGVPLMREGTLLGVLALNRKRAEPFTEKQIALVTTFADQAVIAIENARLFNELHARTTELGRSVEELKMLSEVGRAVSSTLDLRTVLSTVLNASLGVTWANAGAIFRYIRSERAFRLVEAVGWDEALARSVRDLRVAEAETAMGEAAARRIPIQLADLAQRPRAPLRDASLAAGYHSALIVPLVGPERVLGAIILMRQEAGEFPPETVRLMQTLASQSVLAIQNARLFREIAEKSEQLALASQHKSQFLANMSHELRTPLNAILGYAELLVDGIYGQLADRPRGVLERIQNNGKHLLALINDVLDLAKIEAGQLTLTLEDYSLPEVIRSVVTATEPLATAKGLKFITALQDNMPMAHGDARRVSQVLLNLVGNAIKFTDKGEVEVGAAAEKGHFVLTVRDTGPGIAEADQERIFGEFQQIDNSNTRKQGGTGLGLAISKRMVELQGGTISVSSAPGRGSTFRVVLPVHVEVMEEAA
jgi:GAF domain-containing protein/HAMP domain-containing protein/anti-sigma regulatory factor (Ser/Thr protein kinase)